MSIDLDGLSHDQKIVICTLGTLDSMLKKGALVGESPLTEDGLRLFAELEESGFEPTEIELQSALKVILENGIPAADENFVVH